jgi:ankyrin repeat protein
MIELLVHWKKSLSTLVDKDGSTPLHFAASRVFPIAWYNTVFYVSKDKKITWQCFPWIPNLEFELLIIVYKANRVAPYQADKNGSFPIHVAASVGYRGAIEFFQRECPDSVALRDARGRTFLHVAVEKGRVDIVSYVCLDPSLAWILNMQDNDGNTALHLALKARSFWMFFRLFRRREVDLNLTNNDGETYLDVSRSNLPFEMAYTLVNNTLSSSLFN